MGLKNDQCKHKSKLDPDELKMLVREANNHLDELQQQNLSNTEETLYSKITSRTLRKPGTA